MKVQSDCGTRHGVSPPTKTNHPVPHSYPLRRESSPSHQMSQLHALKSEYDNMEESLRDALRHTSCPGMAKPNNIKQQQVYENTFTKRHNYITVYEHEQAHQSGNYRSVTNLAENFRQPQVQHIPSANHSMVSSSFDTNQSGNISSEEFQKYCALLTERIQKMEEQNVQLLRLSEKQKTEYDKVAAQVVQSEQSQRLLLNECSNLRRQVQQLANHNKRLREQHIFSSNMSSPNSPHAPNGSFTSGSGNFFGEDHTGQNFPSSSSSSTEAVTDSFRHLHSSTDQRVPNGSVLGKCTPSDVAAIVELYAALQKSTIADLKTVDPNNPANSTSAAPDIKQPPIPALGVIHEHTGHKKDNFANSDYASPSSICATATCTCCVRPSSHLSPPLSQAQRRLQPQYKSENKSQRPVKTIKSRVMDRSAQDDDNQSFDNNAYVEVELRPGRQFEVTQQVVDVVPSTNRASNFRRDNRLLRSHHNYSNVPPKMKDQRRPSSLVLEGEATPESLAGSSLENQSQPVMTAGLTLSPVSPQANAGVFQKQSGTVNQNTDSSLPPKMRTPENNQEVFERQVKPVTTGKFRTPQRKQSSSSLLCENRSVSGANSSPRTGSKSTSRSSSITDLPPPPVPPPQAAEQMNESIPEASLVTNPAQSSLSQRTRRCSADAAPSTASYDRSKITEKEPEAKAKEGFPRKLSIWKNREETQGRHQAEDKNEHNPTKSPSGYRRSSYSAACRKSQSLDHLYEQAMRENQKMREQSEEKRNVYTQSTTKVFHNVQQPPTFTESLAKQSPSDERKSNDDVFDPSPKFSLQLNPLSTSAYEVMMPLKGSDAGSSDELNFSSIVSRSRQAYELSPSKSRLQKLSDSSFFQKKSTPKDHDQYSDKSQNKDKEFGAVTSLHDDVMSVDQEFTPGEGRSRNRRHSEGSTGNKQKDRLFNNTDRGQFRRHRSVGNDVSINKRKDVVAPQVNCTPRSNSNSDGTTRSIPQPRFPSTNPHSRLQPPAVKPKPQAIKPVSKPNCVKPSDSFVSKRQVSSPKCSEPKIHQSAVAQKSAKSLEEPKAPLPTSRQSSVNETAPDPSRGRSEDKASKKNKDSSPSSGGTKKKASSSGGRESKSLVNLMKAKFVRSSSRGRSSSAGKKNNEKISDNLPKTGNSYIDPRTLSLEPNSYLPPGKDGSSLRKSSKQRLGQKSDAAVGRKLSQPFPNGIGEELRSMTQLNKVTEEVLSDEGFAEGSTIERADKQLTPICEAVPMESNTVSHYENVTFSNASPERKQFNDLNADLRSTETSNFSKHENPNWYDNVVNVEKRTNCAKEKRFQVVPSKAESMKSILDSPPIKQKHTRSKLSNESAYENVPLEVKLNPDTVNENYENTKINDLDERNPTGREVYTTHVTLIRTSPPTRSQPPPQMKAPLKPPKQTTGALGRLMKTVSNLGSKEDLTRSESPPSSQGKLKTSKQGEQRKDFESAYIHSVVSAELAQRLSERSSLSEPITPGALKEPCARRLPFPSSSSVEDSVATESIGTGSSFGSLPSDGIGSHHSGDVIDYHGEVSTGSSSSSVKQPNQKMTKSKRNSRTCFGFDGQSSKTDTGDSSASSSSSEINFKLKSRLPASGSRTPCSRVATSSKLVSSAMSTRRANSADPNNPRRSPNASQSKPDQRRAQSGTRLSKMAPPSKLTSPSKVNELLGSAKKVPNQSSPNCNSNQTTKAKLAPLGYGLPLASSAKSQPKKMGPGLHAHGLTYSSVTDQNQNRPPAPSIPRKPGSSFGISSSCPANGFSASQMDARKIKRKIPSPAGLPRPRPINSAAGGN